MQKRILKSSMSGGGNLLCEKVFIIMLFMMTFFYKINWAKISVIYTVYFIQGLTSFREVIYRVRVTS